MTVELTLSLDDTLFKKMQEEARLRRQDVVDVAVDALEDVFGEDVGPEKVDWDETVAREIAAYHAKHPTLWKTYPGEHVAFLNGQLIDHDLDGVKLSQRIDRCHPNEFVLIRQVEAEPERVLHFRSPRFAQHL